MNQRLAIYPKNVNLLDLPSLPLELRHKLPDTSALYFVLNDDEILYVGRANRLVERWREHHLFAELEQLGVDEMRIAWLNCDKRLLKSSETKFIAHFKPLLNYGSRGRRYQEIIQNKIPCFLTPQKLVLYSGNHGSLVNSKNGKFNWQYGDNYRASAIKDLKELASKFQQFKCRYDSETVLLWADIWLQFIQEALEDKRDFQQAIGNCNYALTISLFSLTGVGSG